MRALSEAIRHVTAHLGQLNRADAPSESPPPSARPSLHAIADNKRLSAGHSMYAESRSLRTTREVVLGVRRAPCPM